MYWAAPDVRTRGFQLFTPGGVIVTAAWVLGSIAYAVYVERFADYGELYGSLGAVIGFLVWLWGSNIAMLYGVELNAAMNRIERRRGVWGNRDDLAVSGAASALAHEQGLNARPIGPCSS